MSSYTLLVPPERGVKVYAKQGVTLNFYYDSNSNELVIVEPEGGSKGQSDPPSRSNGEYVGTATGKVTYLQGEQLCEVSWINRWWQDGRIFPPKKGRWMETYRAEYVKLSQIYYEGKTFQTFYDDPEKEDPVVVEKLKEEEKKKQEALGLNTPPPDNTKSTFNWWWVIIAILILRRL